MIEKTKKRQLIGVLGGVALGASLLTAGSVATASPVQAHGGGLDWQGGHNCNVGSCAGTYHCHQPRGGICARPQPAPAPKPGNTTPSRTCIKEKGESERCSFGATWTSSWCWDLGTPGAVHLEKKVGGSWKRVESDVAERNLSACSADYPWATDLRVRETRIGTYNYRLKFPDGDTYSMRVKVS